MQRPAQTLKTELDVVSSATSLGEGAGRLRPWGGIWLALAASMVVTLTWAPTAGAEPSAAEIAVARKLFREATRFEKEKKWAEAEQKLRAALAIKETPGLRYHLAFCQEKQGKLVNALVDYDRADELIQSGVKAKDVEKLLADARTALRERVPTLTIKLPDDAPDDTVVDVDGAALKSAVLGQAMPINPGSHTVKVSAEGRQPFTAELRLGEKERRTVNVVLPLQTKAKATPPPATAAQGDSGVATDSSGWSTRTWVLLAEGAVTAVGLGVGIFYTLDKGKANDEIDEAESVVDAETGGSSSGCNQAGLSSKARDACDQLPGLFDDRDRANTLATVGFVGAGVGAAAFATTFILWKPESSDEARRRPVFVSRPVPGSGAWVGVAGRF